MADNIICNPTIEQIVDPDLQNFFQFWLKMKNEHTWPQRKDFHPAEITPHLPYVVMHDYEQSTKRYKVRIQGTAIVNSTGAELTGTYIDDFPNSKAMIERFNLIVNNKTPYLIHETDMEWADRNYKRYSTVGCPLFDDDQNVNMLIFRLKLID